MSLSCIKSYLALLSILLLGLPVADATAFWGGEYLVQINGQEFTEQDYRHWWQEWQDPGMAVHESVDPFIDFILLAQEASDMQLFENPRYKKKLDVFLKVRALMQLKAEEVDAHKVIPSREELWQAYLQEYTPILDMQMIAVQEQEQATAIEKFMAQGEAFDQLADAAGLADIAEQLDSTGPMRYTRIPEELRAVALQLKPGEAGGPVRYGHAWYFLKVKQRQDGSDEDFESLKQNLIRSSLKQQENELTQELLDRLKSEYQVSVDQALIDGIGPEGPEKEDAEKIAITIGDLKIPASFVFASIKKTQKSRGHAQREAEALENSKNRVVNDILVQVLTEKASLDRHYEQIPPLKYTYDFYRKYRLIKEFEDTVIRPQVKVTDADIEAFYRENSEQFSQAGLLEYAQVTTNERELAERISMKMKNGAEFFSVMEPISPSGVPIKKEPLARLKPVIQEAVKKLSSGQITTVVDGPNTYFIKVVRAAETKLMPLEQVREMIIKSLEQQFFNDIRANLVRLLRERSSIKVNDQNWKSLRKQLLEESAT